MNRFLVFFLLIFFKAFTQNNIEITYKKYINDNYSIKEEANDYVKKSFNSLKKIIDVPNYRLKIVDNYSLFKYDQMLEPDNIKNLDRAISILAGKQTHYVNIEKKLLYSLSAFKSEYYLVQKEVSKYKWKLTNEYKSILGFNCRKAKSTYEIDDIRGNMSFEFYAWFSDELPSFFGPSDIIGLPGTILEAGTSSFYYKAISIKYKQIPKIKLPNNKIITEEIYADMYKKLLESEFN